MAWADQIFCRFLVELEALRGHTLQLTSNSLKAIAKRTIINYMKTASTYSAPRAWQNYVNFVEMNGNRLSDEFKGYNLFWALHAEHI